MAPVLFRRTTDLDAIRAITRWVATTRNDTFSVYDEGLDLIDDARLLAIAGSMREFLISSGALPSGIDEPPAKRRPDPKWPL